MHGLNVCVRLVLLASCVLLSAPARGADHPATRPLQPPPEGRRQDAAAPLLAHGIHSYGVGAGRIDRRTSPRADATADLSGAATVQEPSLLGSTFKISGSPMAGSVLSFRVSPDGTRVVFIADKDTAGIPELYSAPVDGSAAPVKVSNGLVFGTGDLGVSEFQITPDSTRVVFLADPNTGAGLDEIFSAPISGATPAVRLNVGNDDPVTGLGITPNGQYAVFFGVDTASASGAVEAFRATIGTASSAVQLSDVGLGNALGDVVAADFSPDSSRVVYAADAGPADNVFQWYSVPISAAGPGSDVQISAALSTVGGIRVSPDSTRVAYTSDDNVLARMEVFTKSITGGTRTQLDPSMAGDGATTLEFSPDGTRVVYLADQTTAGVNEVYSAQSLVAGSGVRLNTPMSGAQYADTVAISPDGTTVVYEADQDTQGTYELFKVPIAGGATPVKLHALTAPDDAGSFAGLGTPVLGRRVVYPVFGSAVNLFNVPYDGSATYQQINDPPDAGDILLDAFLPASGRRLMAYGSGPSSGSITRKVFATPIRRDLTVEQINTTSAAGTLGVQGYEISPDEKYGVYLQDRDTAGKPELFSYQLDSDADGVINAQDNCPFIANATQARVVLQATVTALNNTTFSWGAWLDVRFARGPLSQVGSYGTNLTGTLADATGYVETGTPAAGSGWYYLFAPNCPGRSYQSTLGAEPGRDLAALP